MISGDTYLFILEALVAFLVADIAMRAASLATVATDAIVVVAAHEILILSRSVATSLARLAMESPINAPVRASLEQSLGQGSGGAHGDQGSRGQGHTGHDDHDLVQHDEKTTEGKTKRIGMMTSLLQHCNISDPV